MASIFVTVVNTALRSCLNPYSAKVENMVNS